MDTLAKVISLLKKGNYAISLNLKDAYLHIPMHKSHRKYLHFCVKGKRYQFKAMCFGPTQALSVYKDRYSCSSLLANTQYTSL